MARTNAFGGWVTFETAADVAIAKLSVALNSGFADVVGEVAHRIA